MTNTEINKHSKALDDLQNKLVNVMDTKSLLLCAKDSLKNAKGRGFGVGHFEYKVEVAKNRHARAIKSYQSALGLFIEQVEAAEYIKIEMATQSQLS